jgi:poly(3-hydroxybutyrate) depolymerase
MVAQELGIAYHRNNFAIDAHHTMTIRTLFHSAASLLFAALSASFALAQPYGSAGVQTAVAKSQTSAEYGYWEYLPKDYSHTSPQKFGLMVFLHGYGERGSGEVGNAGLGKLVGGSWPTTFIANNARHYPVIVLSPQCSDPVAGQTIHDVCGWWNYARLRNFVTYALARYNIDPRRIYVTGLSMGGGGTIGLVREIRTQVAAAIPVCGTESGSAADANLAAIPLWFAHAIDDGTVNWSSTRNLINQITAETATITTGSDYTDASGPGNVPAGARNQTALYSLGTQTHAWENLGTTTNVDHDKRLRFTLYKDGGHGIWSRVYNDDPNMMNWLFIQRLNEAPQTCNLDINAGGAFDLKDARAALAWMLGFRGTTLENFAGFSGVNAAAIDQFLSAQKASGALDLDGDGEVRATTDGLMLLRIALGITDGVAITNKALNASGSRGNWSAVRNHLVNSCKLTLP